MKDDTEEEMLQPDLKVDLDSGVPKAVGLDLEVTRDDPVSVAAASVEKEPPVSQSAWDRAVVAWIDGHVRSSPIAQASGAWGHLHDVLPKLKELLDREIKN